MSLAPDRNQFWNASDAPAMLGISPYETREDFLKRVKYGIEKPITPAAQYIFDAGHRIEALARPIAEALLGHPLPPKRVTLGKLGATLDGYFCSDELESVNWECKTLNDAIRAALAKAYVTPEPICSNVILPEYLRAQMEHQLLCSDADRCLFTAHADGETVHCWYYPDATMRRRIIDGWAQFERDLAAMPDVMPIRAIEGQLMPVVREFPFMPVVRFGIVGGSLQDVARFETEGREFVKTINQNLVTDQDFADGESDKKNLAKAVELLDALLDAPQDMAALKRVRELFNKARLVLEKQITARSLARKMELIKAAEKSYRDHVDAFNLAEYIANNGLNLSAAIAGLSSIASMQQALSAALLKAQSEATALAAKVRKNLELIAAADAPLLFPNLRDLVTKTPEDLANYLAVTLAKYSAECTATAEAMRKAEVSPTPPTPAQSMAEYYDNERAPAPGKTLNIGQINERLRVVTVTTAQLVALGFPGVEGPRKGLSVWPESDYPRITAVIIERLGK